jgi:hypothetical protein
LDISRLKKATGTGRAFSSLRSWGAPPMEICSARFKAKAVLPIDGRAAMMIISPF